jgi:holo-[acyl-carrier protein] synthase
MIYGIGTDVIEVSRIKKQVESDTGFKEKIFSKKEIEYCDPRRNKEQNYAARYAAKEAFFKALGTGWRFGMEFKEVEVLNDELGKPEIFLSGKAKEFFDEKGLKKIHTTMSHIKETATATVIIEK